MKNHLSFIRIAYDLLLIVSLVAVGSLLVDHQAMCQDKKESASLPTGQAGKLPVTMNVSYKTSDGVSSVRVQVSRKENKKIIPVDNLKAPVNIYLNAVKENNPADGTGWFSKLYLDEEGEGVFEFPSDFNKRISGSHEYKFIVKMDSDPLYENTEEEITVSDAAISIEYSGKDSIKTATAKLTEWKDSAYVPVPETELKLFIKRSFSLLPIGEEGRTTDKNGEVSAELPLDIPGDPDGTVTIVAKVIDHESYGTVEATKKVSWGVLPAIDGDMGRTLWASGNKAPIPLILVALSIITVIWGTLIYLVFQLFKIKRIGKQRIQ